MPDQTATYVQLASIIVYVFTIFGLYKLLTSQKDATIQAKDAQIELLKLQLEQSEANTPDVLVEAHSKRIKLLVEELTRLQADNEASLNDIDAKKKELEITRNDLARLRGQIGRAEELLEDFSCYYCNAPLVDRELYYQTDDEGDVYAAERISYECGYALDDSLEVGECRNTVKAS